MLFIWARGVESPLAFSQEERKVGSRDTVEATQMALGLVPEVLDSVDVIFPVGEQFGVVDAAVLERRDVQHVVGAEGVGVDDAVGDDLVLNDGLQRLALCVPLSSQLAVQGDSPL